MGMYNLLNKMMYEKLNKGSPFEGDEATFSSSLTTIMPIGAALGAFLGGALVNKGRRLGILLNNILILVGAVITLYENYWVIMAGRLILGFGAGVFTVVTSIFINETSPTELSGSLGAIAQF